MVDQKRPSFHFIRACITGVQLSWHQDILIKSFSVQVATRKAPVSQQWRVAPLMKPQLQPLNIRQNALLRLGLFSKKDWVLLLMHKYFARPVKLGTPSL